MVKAKKKSVRADLQEILDTLPPPRSPEELRKIYGPAMERSRKLIRQAFKDANKKEQAKSSKKTSCRRGATR